MLGLLRLTMVFVRVTGKFLIYGPYKVDGKFTTESNEKFNQFLKDRNAEWGYRDIADVKKVAEKNGLSLKVRLVERLLSWPRH